MHKLRNSAATTNITTITDIIAVTINAAIRKINSTIGVTTSGSQNWPPSSTFPINKKPR